MASVDFSKVSIKEKPLYQPPLEEVVEVLRRGLTNAFETVSVELVECPDLTKSPYNLTSPGLGGNPRLMEVGGPTYLMPLVQRDKNYDLAALVRHLRANPAFLIGAGAGPWEYLGVNSEAMINMTVRDGQVDQGTHVVTVDPPGAPKGQARVLQQRLPNNETRTSIIGNYLLCEGKPGKVIKVVAKKRLGVSNYITVLREALKNKYYDKIVGMGGCFVSRGATKTKYHVMPEFSDTPLCTNFEMEKWLHYFELNAPITHMGTLVTGEHGLDLRVQHFHGFSEHGEGGHYHTDTNPDVAEYEGYFVLGSSVIRVDPPVPSHHLARD